MIFATSPASWVSISLYLGGAVCKGTSDIYQFGFFLCVCICLCLCRTLTHARAHKPTQSRHHPYKQQR